MSKKEKQEMKQNRKDRKRKLKKVTLFTGIVLGMFLTISAYLIYNLYRLTSVENLIRYIVMIVIGILSIFSIFKYLKIARNPYLKKYILLIILLILFGGIEYFIGYTIHRGLNVVDNISSKKYKEYSTNLIALKSGNLTDKEDISSDTKIGRITDEEDIEGYVLTKEIIKKDSIDDDQIVDYDDTITMLYDLYDGKIDSAFISGGYVDIYGTIDKFQNIKSETVVLDKFKKKMKVKNTKATSTSTKSIDEPFTLLLMGVDSTEEDLSKVSGLGDSLMLITFNPNTLNVTILSIPRDTYVEITCYGNKLSKITHAATGGDTCMIKTIERTFGIDIDYYAKINFLGLVKIVDALGGVYVDVPYSFCEQNSLRQWDPSNIQYVKKGYQLLNGEQALALSRNRKTSPSCSAEWNKGVRNDFVRGQNQQLIINAIMNKAKSMTSITQFYNLLDAVGNSMTTNMDRKQILSFYNVLKNVMINSKSLQENNDIINMQKMYLNGSGGLIYDNIMNMDLYEYVPSTQSLNAIIKAMKINLELVKDEPATKFSFSADEEYEQEVIGKNLSGGVTKYPTASEVKGNTTTEEVKTCDTNEELGADKVTCVCKNGYTRKNGVCTKEEEKTCTGINEELGADKVTCVCKNGYTRKNGVCTKEEESKKEETPTTPSTDDNKTDNPVVPDTPESESNTSEE